MKLSVTMKSGEKHLIKVKESKEFDININEILNNEDNKFVSFYQEGEANHIFCINEIESIVK